MPINQSNNMPMPMPMPMPSNQSQMPMPMPVSMIGGGVPSLQQPPQLQQPNIQHQQQQQSNEPIFPPHFCPANSSHMMPCCDVFPINNTLHNRAGVPQGIVITPFAQPLPHEAQVPTVDFNGVAIRCDHCRAYINPFVTFRDRGVRWVCNFCQTSNTVADFYLQQLDQQTGYRADILSRPELCSGIYEIPVDDYKTRTPTPPTFIFVLNVSHEAVKTGYLSMVSEIILNSLDTLIHNTTDPRALQQAQQTGKPALSRGRIAFITFDSSYHFYQFNPNLPFPQMHVSGTSEIPIRLPVADTHLHCNIQENYTQIKTFLQMLPTMFQSVGETDPGTIDDNCLATALQAVHSVLEYVGGRIFCFTSKLPNAGPGKLPSRGDNVTQRGSNAGMQLIDPLLSRDKNGNSCYDSYAFRFSRSHFSLDLFVPTPVNQNIQQGGQNSPNTPLPPPKSLDLATLSDLTRLTSGEMYYYPQYQAQGLEQLQSSTNPSLPFSTKLSQFCQDPLGNDLYRILNTQTAWEACYRLRVAGDIMISDVYGNFSISGQSLIILPTVDQRKTLTFEFRPPDVPKNTSGPQSRVVYIQGALLYTTGWGERRIRIFSHCLPTVHTQGELYQRANQGAIATLLAKQCVGLSIPQNSGGLSKGRQHFLTKVISLLKSYRAATSQDPHFDFVQSPTLGKLMSYTLEFTKSIAMRDINDIHIDLRVFLLYKMLSMSQKQCETFVQPLFISLNQHLNAGINNNNDKDKVGLPMFNEQLELQKQSQLSGNSIQPSGIIPAPYQLPPTLPLSQQYLTSDGFYLVSNGVHIFLFIGSGYEQTHSPVLGQLFGMQSDNSLALLPPPTTPINQSNSILYKLYSILNVLRGVVGIGGNNGLVYQEQSTIDIGYQKIVILRESTLQLEQKPLPAEFISNFGDDPQCNVMSQQQFQQLLLKP
jgi:protein transport protein SEC24